MAFTNPYLQGVYDDLAKRNPEQKEFLQAVEEVLESLEPVVAAHPEYEKASLIERLVEPERVIHPRHTEHDDALRLNQALDQACLFIFRMGLNNGLQAFENFLNSLQEFLLLSIALCKALVHFVQISIFDRHGIHSPFWWAAVFRFRPHCRTP